MDDQHSARLRGSATRAVALMRLRRQCAPPRDPPIVCHVSSVFRRFTANVGRIYAAQLVTGLFGVAFVPFAVERLGLEGYALWSVYGILQGYIVLAELGLGKNMVRLLASTDHPGTRLRLLQTASATFVFVAVGLLLAAWPLAVVASDVLFPVAASARLTVRGIALLAVADYLLGIPTAMRVGMTMADRRFDRLASFNAFAGLLRFGTGAAAVGFGWSPLGVVAATVLRRLPEWAVAEAMLEPLPRGWARPRAERDGVHQFVGQTLELSAAQVLQVTVISMGTFLVGWRSGLAGVGAFRAVFDVVAKVWFISSGIGVVLFPTLSGAVSSPSRRAEVAAVLPPLLSLSFAAFAVLAAAGGVATPLAVALLRFDFPEAPAVFALLLGGIVFTAHANVSYELLQSLAAYRRIAVLNAATLVFYVAATWVVPVTSPTVAVAAAWWLAQLASALAADALGSAALAAGPVPWTRRVAPISLVATSVWAAVRPGAASMGAVAAAAIATAAILPSTWRRLAHIRRAATPSVPPS